MRTRRIEATIARLHGREDRRRGTRAAVAASTILLALTACGGGDGSAVVPTANAPAATTLSCDESMKAAFKPDANTTVLLVKAFRKGDALTLSSAVTPTTPVAANDLCVVKLNVGPGNPGPANAPSTSAGIGIEVWLPTVANWNERIHVKGGGGWSGLTESSLTQLAGVVKVVVGTVTPAEIAGVEGAVSASTDTGHVTGTTGASFAMDPDGTVSKAQWADFSERAVHEMTVKTKALAKAYYGRDARFSYFVGNSTGGRQAHKAAQTYPADFDGILAGMPAINLTKAGTAGLYPRIVSQIDLGGTNLTSGQLSLVSNAAISACDVVGSQHLGYVLDPSQCRYDPTLDTSVLCAASGGSNATSNCVSTVQATAINKIWYGQTFDGSVPPPAADNGFGVTPAAPQKWYGPARGTDISVVAGASPLSPVALGLATDVVALEEQNSTLGTPSFQNATGNGRNGWMNLGYADLAMAFDRGVALQAAFSYVNTDNPDLSVFRDRGGKMIAFHGLADFLIPPQGTINYYNRVASQMGGVVTIQNFYRFYLVPAMSHGFANGTSNFAANPPLPTESQLYDALRNWVENGVAPGRIDVSTQDGAKSGPLCLYPQRAKYQSGNPGQTASYICSL